MKQFYFLLFFGWAITLHAQVCDCKSNYEWTKQTIEENDAGFQYAIDTKGKIAYEQHNAFIEEKISNVDKLEDCTELIYEWLMFFRSGHLSIQLLNQTQEAPDEAQRTDEEIRESFKDWQKLIVDVEEFKTQLQSKTKNDFEGIWVSQPYTIGIKKVKNEYLGFVIEADGVYWSPGQVKLKIHNDLSATFYMRDHSAQKFNAAKLMGDNYLEMGFITLKRVYPITGPQPEVEQYLKVISAENPFFEEINEQTVYMRIPRFWASERKKIDSVIAANKEKFLNTPNFILDLRDNGGGSDSSFKELLPILYTNPIRTVGVEMLSTPLNNQRMLDFINNDAYGFDEEGKKWAQKAYDTLSNHIGEFVMLTEESITETTFDKVHKYPENIGIIINENNGSTTEQFLLAAKQSKKVKLFGTTTMGVLDISNMYSVISPCKEFQLGYSLSKSMRIPEMTIDGKGIQPDYYIDKDIPKQSWVKYVTGILNE